MGFLNNLFGNSKKAIFQDSDLGEFAALSHRGNTITWKGRIKFLDELVSLFISGTSDQLDTQQKASLLDMVKNENSIALEIDEALRTKFEEADKQYSKWKDHFHFISISTINNEISITFEEKESFYHFNVFFLNGKQVGISIDS